MDSAYDAAAIRKKARKFKQEVLIKPVDRPQAKVPAKWTEEQQQQFKIRTIVEQQNGRLKDEFGRPDHLRSWRRQSHGASDVWRPCPDRGSDPANGAVRNS